MQLNLKIIHKKSSRVMAHLGIEPGGAVHIGRDPAFCNAREILKIISKDQRISGKHVIIEHDHHEIKVRDVGSTNGTTVDGMKYRNDEVGHSFDNGSELDVEIGDFFVFQLEWTTPIEATDTGTETEEPESFTVNSNEDDSVTESNDQPESNPEADFADNKTTQHGNVEPRRRSDSQSDLFDPNDYPPPTTYRQDSEEISGWGDDDW